MKRKGFGPLIMMGDGDDDVIIDIGGTSGQGSEQPYAMSFDDWNSGGFFWAYDEDKDGVGSAKEYYKWWSENGWSVELWYELNGNDFPWLGDTGGSEPEPQP